VSRLTEAPYSDNPASDRANIQTMAPVQVYMASPINTNFPSPSFPSTAASRYTPIERTASADPFLDDSVSPHPAQRESRPRNATASSYNSTLEPTPTTSQSMDMSASSHTRRASPQQSIAPVPHPVYSHAPASAFLPPSLELPQTARPLAANTSPQRMPAVPYQLQTPTRIQIPPYQSPSPFRDDCSPQRGPSPSAGYALSARPSVSYTQGAYSFHESPHVRDLSHPPGYQQDQSPFHDKPVEFCQEANYQATLSPLSATRKGAGILDME
jgi:hypothetical protein